MVNRHVVLWYSDQIATYFGLVISIILLIIIIKKLACDSKTNEKHPKCFQILVYIMYSMAVIYFILMSLILIGLPMINSTSNGSDHHQICEILYFPIIPCMTVSQICIVNFFIERLQISFNGTIFALSTHCINAFRIIISAIWIVLAVIAAINMNVGPYNIWEDQVDYTGDGVTCSQYSLEQNIVYVLATASAGFLIFFSCIIIWILFMNRLYKLLKSTPIRHKSGSKSVDVDGNVTYTAENRWKNEEFLVIMKEQTMVVSIVIFSTIIAWTLMGTGLIGNAPVLIDFVSTLFIIFVSFKFNRWYFELFGCHVLTKKCCKYCESCIIKKLQTNDQVKLSEIVRVESVSNVKSGKLKSNTSNNKTMEVTVTGGNIEHDTRSQHE